MKQVHSYYIIAAINSSLTSLYFVSSLEAARHVTETLKSANSCLLLETLKRQVPKN